MFEFYEGRVNSKVTRSIKEFIQEVNDEDVYEIGSIKYEDKIGSGWGSCKIGSGGNYSKIGASGTYAKIGTSGHCAQIGSTGDYVSIGASGHCTQIGSTGDYAQIGTSNRQIEIGSSGDYAQIGSGGDSAKIISTGRAARIGTAGDFAKVEVEGSYGVAAAMGAKSLIKAREGTWISLCEFEELPGGEPKPTFAASAQIGNEEYVDNNGEVLDENHYYGLYKKQFHRIDTSDGMNTVILKEKIKQGMVITEGCSFEGRPVWVIKREGYAAHGTTLKTAIEELRRKIEVNQETRERIEEFQKEFQEGEKYSVSKYYEWHQKLTGSCEYGRNEFIKTHGFNMDDKYTVEEFIAATENHFGGDIIKMLKNT